MINKKLLKPINKSGYGEIVGTTTHDTLLNRDKAEQHPISAITDLQTTLDAKQAKLTAGAGIDITGDTISSTTVVSPDTALTSKTNTFEFRQVIKSGGSGLLDLQTSTGSVLNTTYDLASTSVKLTSPNTTSMTFTAKDFNFNSKELKNIATPITNKSAANKEYVDEEIVKVNSSLTNLAKAVNILVGTFDVSWTSKTTAVDAGTNLKTAIGDVLWSEVIKPENKNKYFIKAIFAATAEGTAFHEKIESYNILSTSGQEVYFSGATSFTHLRYNDPGNGATVETILMVNSEGNVRFYVKFDGTLNSNFSISKVKLFINEIF